MIDTDKPDLNEDLLIHYGVAGMKWGKRKKAGASEIRRDRRALRVQKDKRAAVKDQMKAAKTDKAKADLKAKMNKMDEAYKNDPRHVTARRLTTGEKAASIVIGGPLGLALIAGTSLSSRRAEQRLDP